MYISALDLVYFRNYIQQHIEFSPETNIIYGNNAQGKTNILEAIYMFSAGKSHRAGNDREVINYESNFARTGIEFHTETRDYSAQMRILRNGRKGIKINNIPIVKLSQLMNYFNSVMFSPEDLEIVKGSPGKRRRFADSAISQLHPSYLAELIDYNKALEQKNSLLRNPRSRGDSASMSVWNLQLASSAAKIMEYRRGFIKELNGFASEIQSQICSDKLSISYNPNIKIEDTSANGIAAFLDERCSHEIESASVLYGVQRDDINIDVNGKQAKIFCSQGQQRTAALSLKIAEAEHIKTIKGEYPVLLLDDILSELDSTRREFLSEKISGKQVMITCTEPSVTETADKVRLIHVDSGKII